MNIRTQSVGMGNLITRTMKAAAYAAWKATHSSEAAYIESLMTALPARQRYAQQVSDIIDRWSAARPNDAEAAKARALLSEYHSALSQFSNGVRAAAEAAVADGHTSLYVDWPYIGTGSRQQLPPQTSEPPYAMNGLGVWPLIVVAVVAVGAVAIVVAYLGNAGMDAAVRERTTKQALDAIIAANRLDLIPGVVGSGTSSGSVATGFGMVGGLAALGLLAWVLSTNRRRRAT